MLPSLNRLKGAGFSPRDDFIQVANQGIRSALEMGVEMDTSNIQGQIDVFVKECVEDPASPIPGIGNLRIEAINLWLNI